MPIVIFAVAVAVFAFVLRYTVYGRYIYAVGGNLRSAKTSGINTRAIVLLVYVVSGLLAGWPAFCWRRAPRRRCRRPACPTS